MADIACNNACNIIIAAQRYHPWSSIPLRGCLILDFGSTGRDKMNGTVRDDDGNPLAQTHTSLAHMWPRDPQEPAHIYPNRTPHAKNAWDHNFVHGFHSSKARRKVRRCGLAASSRARNAWFPSS